VSRSSVARVVFGLTALTVLVGLIVQIGVSVNAAAEDSYFQGAAARIFNMFCYFTVQSNTIVMVTTALLAIDPTRDSTVFRMFRIAGLIDIAITGVVYHLALADLQQLDGTALVADQLLHTVVPLLAVIGWIVFGPRGRITWRDVGLATIIPIAWCVFTLIRGPIVDFYPYPFIDVRVHGYATVLLNIFFVALLFVALAAAALGGDRWLARRGLGSGDQTLRTASP
jgi:hypothetical protein